MTQLTVVGDDHRFAPEKIIHMEDATAILKPHGAIHLTPKPGFDGIRAGKFDMAALAFEMCDRRVDDFLKVIGMVIQNGHRFLLDESHEYDPEVPF